MTLTTTHAVSTISLELDLSQSWYQNITLKTQ